MLHPKWRMLEVDVGRDKARCSCANPEAFVVGYAPLAERSSTVVNACIGADNSNRASKIGPPVRQYTAENQSDTGGTNPGMAY